MRFSLSVKCAFYCSCCYFLLLVLTDCKGKGASSDERKAALKTADSFVTQEGLPKHTRITIMAQYAEPALFRNMFTSELSSVRQFFFILRLLKRGCS